MSGILDSKQRFVDTVITAEGRRQLASGEFKLFKIPVPMGHIWEKKVPIPGVRVSL